jgi:hypothetical protein
VPTRNINAAFSAGIRRHIGIEYKEDPPVCTRIFHMDSSTSKFEDFQLWENYGPPVRKDPGTPVIFGEARQSFSKRFVHETYALGDLIPKEDWADDKYGVLHRLLPAKGGGMARVFRTNYDIQHANMFVNLGYVSGSSVAGSFDGVSLFNTAHPISASTAGTTVSNRPSTDVDLSISSYQAAATNIRTQYEANNYTYLDNEPRMLTVHPSLQYVAKQILRGQWERGTADRNTNYITDDNIDLCTWKYFKKSGSTGTNNAWFITGRNHELMSFMRAAYDVESDFDLYVLAYVFTADMRFSFGWVDWRGTYGSVGA